MNDEESRGLDTHFGRITLHYVIRKSAQAHSMRTPLGGQWHTRLLMTRAHKMPERHK